MTANLLSEGAVVALGERRIVGAFALAGVQVRAVEGATEVRAAWESLDEGVALVILTPHAGQVLGDEIDAVDVPLTAVLPS